MPDELTEMTWNAAAPPALPRPSVGQKWAMYLRGVGVVLATYFCLSFLLIFALVEKLFPRLGISQNFARLWGIISLRLCGVRLVRIGTPMKGGGAIVANHAGWIDIFTMLAADGVYFVAKSEVARWPFMGRVSSLAGTVFIERKRAEAKRQEEVLHARLTKGDRLCFFPEGTSTDGRRVLGFKTTLFSVFMNETLKGDTLVQPVSIFYRAPKSLPKEFYGWWGEMGFGAHLATVLAHSRGGQVEVVFHPPVLAGDFADRKKLSAHCEAAVRAGLEARMATS